MLYPVELGVLLAVRWEILAERFAFARVSVWRPFVILLGSGFAWEMLIRAGN